MYLREFKVYRNDFRETNVNSFIGPLIQVFKNFFLYTSTMIVDPKSQTKRYLVKKKDKITIHIVDFSQTKTLVAFTA